MRVLRYERYVNPYKLWKKRQIYSFSREIFRILPRNSSLPQFMPPEKIYIFLRDLKVKSLYNNLFYDVETCKVLHEMMNTVMPIEKKKLDVLNHSSDSAME